MLKTNREMDRKEKGNSKTGNKETDKRLYTLAEEKPAKAVVKMGVPLIAGMFIMVLYNLVDTFFIGMTGDAYQLAAVNLAYPVMMVMIAVSNMVGTGASSLIARCMGAGDIDRAEHTLSVGFELTCVSAIIVSVIGILFIGGITTALGAKSNTFVHTENYIFIILIGSIFIMGNYTFGQFLRSEGSVRYSIMGMVVGTIANIILDPIFIFALGMQIRGAAIATVLGNGIGTAASLLYYAKGKTLLAPRRGYLAIKSNRTRMGSYNDKEAVVDSGSHTVTGAAFEADADLQSSDSMETDRKTAVNLKKSPPGFITDKEIVKEIYRIGIPASLETLLTSAAYIVLNNLAVSYGELTVAAMGISQKILSLGSYVYQGFAAGVQPLMGYNYGAKNHRRMMDILKAGLAVVTGTELVIMAVCGIFAPFLIGIFTGSHEVIRIGTHVLRTVMWILPFVGSVSMCRMSFQAMGKPMYALGITIVRQVILYVPLLFILDHIFGFDGMLWAQPITECIMMISSVWLLVHTIGNNTEG